MRKVHIITVLILLALTLSILGVFLYLRYNSFKRRLVQLAENEAKKWKNQKETSTKLSSLLISYWESVGRSFTKSQMQSQSVHSSNPWSSAFISFLFFQAGAKDKFPYSSAHSGYFQAAKRNKENPSAALRGFRITDYKPQIGDLVCYTRQSGKGYDSTGHFPSHGEIVIAKTKNTIKAIGGNVSNTVKISTYSLDENGFLTTKEHPFFMVIQNNLK